MSDIEDKISDPTKRGDPSKASGAVYDMSQQLMVLKDLTIRFNCVEEIQKQQLIGFGQMIPNTVGNKVEVHINMDNQTVHIKTVSERNSQGNSKFRKTKRVKDLLPHIVEWVSFIVWDNTAVMISVDNTIIWDSRNV